jgi:hypothetical protein
VVHRPAAGGEEREGGEGPSGTGTHHHAGSFRLTYKNTKLPGKMAIFVRIISL